MSIDETDQDRKDIEEWADRYGSGRLLRALKEDGLPRHLYLEERVAYELPGFEVDFEDSFQFDDMEDVDGVVSEALDSVLEELDFSGIAYDVCDVVQRKTEYEDRPAVRVREWGDGLTVVGNILSPNGSILIDSDYPSNVPTRGEPPLRRRLMPRRTECGIQLPKRHFNRLQSFKLT